MVLRITLTAAGLPREVAMVQTWTGKKRPAQRALSGKFDAPLLVFRRASGRHATALLQTDSERARRMRNARRLSRCRWMLNAL